MKKFKLSNKYHDRLLEILKEKDMLGKTDIQLIVEGRYEEYKDIFMNLWELQRIEEIESKYPSINELKELLAAIKEQSIAKGFNLEFLDYLNDIEDNKTHAIMTAYLFGVMVGKEQVRENIKII